ncbi:MAG: hypothetical protein EXR35_09895 [Limnohabitans sp.]|nr:hypothetical protein [Limnohabitans sp.]
MKTPVLSNETRLHALQLCGRWLRASRGVSVLNGCGCGIDLAIDAGVLDGMLWESIIERFEKRTPIAKWLKSQPSAGRRGSIEPLLSLLAEGHGPKGQKNGADLVQALEMSIASIEAHHS